MKEIHVKLWHGGIIGPYFFQNDSGNAVTVNAERYRSMLTKFLRQKIDEFHLNDMSFQQYSATCHTKVTIHLMQERFT